MTDPARGAAATTLVSPDVAVVTPPTRSTGLSSGEFVELALQFGLLTLIVRQFRLESGSFSDLTNLAFAGFLVHSVLPFQHRLPFFLLLSLGGIGVVLGISTGAALVALGLVLIGICHLPIPFRARVGLLLCAAAVLAMLRMNVIPSSWSPAIWPVLGSMFMFRLLVYLYDLRHEPGRPSPSRTLSYFFLLPNVCFPLFPVVDYKTFRRTYYNDRAYDIYRRGIGWMWRGVVQLILYRFVYHYLTVSPAEVRTASDLFAYLGSNFLLYLRVSGQFHIIVGMLLLFGFNLPETHRLYYLASSFNDFWRRINIYWKDFMMKLFYYPAYFKLRHRGPTVALVVSTCFVFASTWLLHSYQWFWLRGSFPLAWQDGVFWGVLAVLVVVNSLREAKYGRKRTLATPQWTFGASARLSFRIALTFVAICVLWSLWTAESLEEWLGLWSIGGRQLLLAALGLVSFVLFATVAGPFAAPGSPVRRGWSASTPIMFVRSPAAVGAAMLVVYVLGLPDVYGRMGWPFRGVLDGVRKDKLSWRDADLAERGYYENLLHVDRFNTQLWQVYSNRPVDEDLHTDVVVPTGDFLKTELRPAANMRLRGKNFSTNRWGMRDKDYEKERPPGTYRIALLGSSHVVGAGVADEETFETLLEERLNREHRGAKYANYEILNFAVGAYGPLQQMVTLERKALAFEPDALFYVAHSRDTNRAVGHLVDRIKSRVDPPYDFLRSLVQRAGVTERTPNFLIGRKLQPHTMELVAWTYRRTVELCRERSILPVWVFLSLVQEESDPSELEQLARDAGFVTIDLSRVYDGYDRDVLRVSEGDAHPNAMGHRLIADRLLDTIMSDTALRSKLFAGRAESDTAGGTARASR